MRVVSLFDGIACARIALERLRIDPDVYVSAEIDHKLATFARSRFPRIKSVGDVRNVTVTGKVDLLIGGSPCQDLSIAGPKRMGLSGSKSGVFFEYIRVLNECKPTYFLFENVASMSKDTNNTISEYLGVQPILIDSALVSAQRRKRLYWTNIPGVVQPEDRGVKLVDVLEVIIPPKYLLSDKAIAYMGREDHQGRIKWDYGYHSDTKNDKSATVTSNFYRGVPNNVLVDRYHKLYRKFMPIECERLQTVPDNYTLGMSDTARYKALGNGFTVDVIAHILSFIPGV